MDCGRKSKREARVLVHVSDKIMTHADASTAELLAILPEISGTGEMYSNEPLLANLRTETTPEIKTDSYSVYQSLSQLLSQVLFSFLGYASVQIRLIW